jgi:hypothetical protein
MAAVGVAALILAIMAILFAILPLIYTQLAAMVIGVIAVVLGVWGRKQAKGEGQPTGLPITAAALGGVAILLGAVLYGALIYSGGRVGNELVKKIGSEFQRSSERGGQEFRQAVERAIRGAKLQRGRPLPKPALKAKPKAPPAKAPPAKAPPRTKSK